MDLNFINSILSNPSWDVVVFLAFIAVGFFYGISAGRSNLLALLFSLYIAGFIFENFYYLDKLITGQNIMELFLFKSFIFAVLAGALFILFSNVLISGYDSGARNWWKSLLLSFMTTGLLFSFLFHLFPGKEIFTFSPMIQSLFASDAAFFWWLTLPLVALFLARK